MSVRVLSLFDTSIHDCPVISTVSKTEGIFKGLSPFVLGPCPLYDGMSSRNMENAWQYSKVYPEHTDLDGNPTNKYWEWAKDGWNNPRAVRYPMGKGRKPEFSLWRTGKKWRKLDYVSARKAIYGPLYANAVRKTDAYKELVAAYKSSKKIVLLDYDAYDHAKLGMSLTDVLNNPNRKMGHAFVLAMMLTNDPALKEMEL